MIAIVKRQLFCPRPKLFIQKAMVSNMVRAVDRELEIVQFAMLWLLSYLFLLRLPSESLPACKGSPDDVGASAEQKLVWRDGDSICLRLLRRKNRPKGSGVLRRVCSCRGGAHTCAVHMLWDKFFAALPDGAHPWQHIAPGLARDRLRLMLSNLGVPDAASYGTQDFRRGHAEDLRKSGCSLAEILRAGQWKSAAFTKYIDEADLEKDVAFAVAVESDDEEWVD